MTAGAGPVRFGILGTGFISAVHAACAMRSEHVELVAVASARGRAVRERVGELGADVRLLTPAELLEAGEVEAILVATRTSEHASHAVEVLASGRHLLLEKPGATTVTGQQLIADAAAQRPELVAMVAYHRRHDPRFCALAERVAAGAVGEPFAVHLTTREDFPPSAEDDAAAGGFIMDLGVHDFDTARWLLRSDPTSVFAHAHAPVHTEGGPDNVYVTLALGDAAATVHLSRTSRVGMDVRCEVVGTEGSMWIAERAVGGGTALLTAAVADRFPDDCRDRFPDAYQRQMDAFGMACRGRTVAGATLEDDRWAVATAVAARASAARGEPLDVGPSWGWDAGGAAGGTG
jgi:scyllo-inositol 2-dehydrogenase (NAD+)